MRIGQLAGKAGVNIQTIRFYERQRVLERAERNQSGYRSYAEKDLLKLRFIKQSQELGFTLKEIKQLMQLHSAAAALPAGPSRRSREWRDIAQLTRIKLQDVEHKLHGLKTMRRQLLAMLDKLETTTSAGCPAPPKASR
jgi:DNA-binding transcriptional MerR regulator